MSLRDFAHDVQSEAGVTVIVVSFTLIHTAPQRLKKLLHSCRPNRSAAIQDRNMNIGLLTGHNDPHRCIRCPVLDGVQNEISDQLLQTWAVPDTITFPLYRQIQLAIRMYRAKLVQFVAKYGSQVHMGGSYIDAKTELRPVEIAEIVEKGLHAGAASDQATRSTRHSLSGIQPDERRCGHLNGLERTAHIVPEHSEKQVASLVHLLAEMNRPVNRGGWLV
ncbi:hypothetical protein P3T43_005818 [Paraburkholderia sp. GAS41]